LAYCSGVFVPRAFCPYKGTDESTRAAKRNSCIGKPEEFEPS
jgi:hypothetical protein